MLSKELIEKLQDKEIREETLVYGLMQFPLSEEDQFNIYLLLQTAEEQILMIEFLASHLDATKQEVMKAAFQIAKSAMKNSKKH